MKTQYNVMLLYQNQVTHRKTIHFLLVIGPVPLGQVAVRTIHLSIQLNHEVLEEICEPKLTFVIHFGPTLKSVAYYAAILPFTPYTILCIIYLIKKPAFNLQLPLGYAFALLKMMHNFLNGSFFIFFVASGSYEISLTKMHAHYRGKG